MYSLVVFIICGKFLVISSSNNTPVKFSMCYCPYSSWMLFPILFSHSFFTLCPHSVQCLPLWVPVKPVNRMGYHSRGYLAYLAGEILHMKLRSLLSWLNDLNFESFWGSLAQSDEPLNKVTQIQNKWDLILALQEQTAILWRGPCGRDWWVASRSWSPANKQCHESYNSKRLNSVNSQWTLNRIWSLKWDSRLSQHLDFRLARL